MTGERYRRAQKRPVCLELHDRNSCAGTPRLQPHTAPDAHGASIARRSSSSIAAAALAPVELLAGALSAARWFAAGLTGPQPPFEAVSCASLFGLCPPRSKNLKAKDPSTYRQQSKIQSPKSRSHRIDRQPAAQMQRASAMSGDEMPRTRRSSEGLQSTRAGQL